MGDWSDNSRRYKLERRRDDPDERPRGRNTTSAGRKVLLDRLSARRFDLLRAIEWREESKGRRQRSPHAWDWSPDIKWYAKRYALALQACWAAGIEVKA